MFPFAEMTAWKPNPHMYRKVIGTTEVVCGILMAIIPGWSHYVNFVYAGDDYLSEMKDLK